MTDLGEKCRRGPENHANNTNMRDGGMQSDFACDLSFFRIRVSVGPARGIPHRGRTPPSGTKVWPWTDDSRVPFCRPHRSFILSVAKASIHSEVL